MQTVGVQASTVSSFFSIVVVSVFPFFFYLLVCFHFIPTATEHVFADLK